MPAARSLARCLLGAQLLALGGGSVTLLTGCSDIITYADQTRDAGLVAYNQADYPKAAGAFRSALRQDPRDYMSHYYLGMSSLQMGNYRRAAEEQNFFLRGFNYLLIVKKP